MTISHSVFAVDVGSPKNFAWVHSENKFGTEGNKLIEAILNDIRDGKSPAIGFECPLFIPVPREWSQIGKARDGEGNRAWSGGAGGAVTCYGLHEIAWVLQKLKQGLAAEGVVAPTLTFSPDEWSAGDAYILLWEAFVSGKAKSKSKNAGHRGDAKIAMKAFQTIAKRGAWYEARIVKPSENAESLNLAAFAARWSGWPVTDEQLRETAIVVKP